MTAHRDAADDMRVHFGTRTVVVQQSFPSGALSDPTGYVLRALKSPRSMELDSLAERLEFTIFQREQ